jgi:cytochrome c-type biogenesis protein CcmE
MSPAAKTRLRFVLIVLLCLGAALGIALYALRDNVTFFYSPSDILRLEKTDAARFAAGREFRLGGMVKEGSVRRDGTTVEIAFIVTDYKNERPVVYTGLLPDLFREGQGVIATGALDEAGLFRARELLAKHDENYMPPEVARAMKKTEEGAP